MSLPLVKVAKQQTAASVTDGIQTGKNTPKGFSSQRKSLLGSKKEGKLKRNIFFSLMWPIFYHLLSVFMHKMVSSLILRWMFELFVLITELFGFLKVV